MKLMRESCIKAAMFLFLFTIICGVLYTGVVTGFAQLLFPHQANGSIIEVDGKKYGSELLAQQYNDNTHMWGRIMDVDVTTFKDKDNQILMYAKPSNLSPNSERFKALVEERITMIKKANPDMKSKAIPVELLTNSGSGLDPHISTAAANYQVARIAKANHLKEQQVRDMIERSTTNKLLGIFGENTVNVLKVNLILDGILS